MELLDDNNAVKLLERQYLKNRYGESYIACEDLDFIWTNDEVEEFDLMWMAGKTLLEISSYFKRTQEEVLILALDRGTKKKINPRKGGLLGEVSYLQRKHKSS